MILILFVILAEFKMQNVSRIQRVHEFDHISSVNKRDLPKLEYIIEDLDYVVDEVITNDDSHAILGVSYTCLKNPKEYNKRVDVMVFPIYPLNVEYKLAKNDFWINQMTDPIIIKDVRKYNKIDSETYDILTGCTKTILLFNQNLANNYKIYKRSVLDLIKSSTVD